MPSRGEEGQTENCHNASDEGVRDGEGLHSRHR